MKINAVMNFPTMITIEIKPFGDYKEKKLSTFELSLKDKCRNKYYLNNFNCCKIGNDIFIEDCGFLP